MGQNEKGKTKKKSKRASEARSHAVGQNEKGKTKKKVREIRRQGLKLWEEKRKKMQERFGGKV